MVADCMEAEKRRFAEIDLGKREYTMAIIKRGTLRSSWRRRYRSGWNEVIPYMKFSPDIRKAIYTTNSV